MVPLKRIHKSTRPLSIPGMVLIMSLMVAVPACRKEGFKTSSCSGSWPKEHAHSDVLMKVMEAHVDRGLPGITVLVRDSSGTFIGSAGKADLASGTPMRPCNVSKVASVTKMMMGALTMQLVADGSIELDAKAGQYLPDAVTEEVENAEEATVRQLMQHTSGVYDVVSDQDFYLSILDEPDQEWTPNELLEFVEGEDAYFDPGADDHYSNTNFLLLSLIIEEVSGRSHATLLKENVIDAAGMNTTYYAPYDEVPDELAHGYFDLYNNGKIGDLTPYNTGNGNGYTGVYSTVEDLQAFVEALFRAKKLIPKPQLEEMLSFRPEEDDGKAFGLACYRDFTERPADEEAYGHRGRDLAYSAGAYYFPEQDLTLTLLVNYGTNADSELKEVFMDLRDALVDKALQ